MYVCALWQHDQILSEEVFGVTEDTITFPDSKLENTSTYRFNHVFNGFRELQNAFDKAYSPMIRNVNNGENAMLVFGGLPICESMDFFTSMNGRIGIINQAAQLLLRSNTISSSSNNKTVTLSWYKIDNKGTENISDLLRMSSSLHSTDKAAGDGKDGNLVLRELGKGRGMIVPGLWEVEVTKPQDVDAVIAHVQRMLPAAKHDGKSHSIIQLTVTPNDSYDPDNKKSKLKDDSPDIGRLTFVLLSNVSRPPAPSTDSSAPQHLQLYPWVGQLEDILQWIDNKRPSPPFHKSRILLLLRDALCTRMTCGISLFLQPSVDALSVNTLWLQLLSHISSTNAERSSAINTLPIHSSVSIAPMLAATANTQSMTKEQALLHNVSSSKQAPVASTTTTPRGVSKAKPRFNASNNTSNNGSAGKKSILKNSSAKPSKSFSQGQGTRSPHHSRHQHQQRSLESHDDFLHQLPPGHDMAAPLEDNLDDDAHSRDFDRHAQRSSSHARGGGDGLPPTPSVEEVRQQQQLYQHQLQYQRQFYEQQQRASAGAGASAAGSIPPPQGAPPARSQQQQGQFQQGQSRAQQQPQQLLSPPPPPPGVFHAHSSTDPRQHHQQRQQQQQQQQQQYSPQDTTYDNSLLPPQMQTSYHQQQTYPQHQYHQQQQLPDENQRPRENIQGEDGEADRKDAETVEALLFSLQSSRDEVDSLKKSLLLCQQSLEFHKSEHEALSSAKEGAGRTLKSKDRDRLKKALQELKDYEVYREVMEAAMSRMQNEIDKLEGDNAHHKQLTTHLEKELRKSKNITHKITRETSDFEKSKVALHDRVSSAEKEARRLSRERDAAVLALSQYKAEKARDEEDLKSSRRVKHKEVLEMKKKVADVNMQLKMQAEESETSAHLHAQDMKKLQTAHKKSLEMLMACQEENDLLRAAVTELEEDKEATAMAEESAARNNNKNNKMTRDSQLVRQSSNPSPLTNLFKSGEHSMDGSSSSAAVSEEENDHDDGDGDGDESRESEIRIKEVKGNSGKPKGKRKPTIVFVDDYENGDIYMEEDESSVLTSNLESLNSNLERKQRVKSIHFAPKASQEEE
jgi:hypothetical protein